MTHTDAFVSSVGAQKLFPSRALALRTVCTQPRARSARGTAPRAEFVIGNQFGTGGELHKSNGATTTTVTEGAKDAIAQSLAALKPSLGERARTVVHISRTGTLCTNSSKHPGTPFGSHVDYIIDDRGRPVMLLSANAAHTANLRFNPQCSLFTQPISSSGQGGTRATLMGHMMPLPEEEVPDFVDTYVFFHPHAGQALAFPEKFKFFRMEVDDVYFVGGFGVSATFVDVQEYANASPDPLAFHAPDIIANINHKQKDDLELMCRVFLELNDVQDVQMVALDRLGFDLRVRKGAGKTCEFRIGFTEGAVANEFDAYSTLTKVVQEAWERENGMIEDWKDQPERPAIMYYSGSRDGGFTFK